jgi:hypothetical protein
MKFMPPINDVVPVKLRIVDVEEQREINQVIIEQLIEVNQGVLDEYLLKPIKLIKMTRDFFKRTT